MVQEDGSYSLDTKIIQKKIQLLLPKRRRSLSFKKLKTSNLQLVEILYLKFSLCFPNNELEAFDDINGPFLYSESSKGRRGFEVHVFCIHESNSLLREVRVKHGCWKNTQATLSFFLRFAHGRVYQFFVTILQACTEQVMPLCSTGENSIFPEWSVCIPFTMVYAI